jgi:hypothetical protein
LYSRCREVVGILHKNYWYKSVAIRTAKSTAGTSTDAYVMLCGARYGSRGQLAIGASITTMLQHIPRTWFGLFLFLAKKDTLRVIRFPVLQVCLLFSFSPPEGRILF